MNFIQNDANIVHSNSRSFDWLLKKVHKISLVKTLTVWQLKIELESLHKLKFYPSVLLLTIKMSQSAREKLDSYCKDTICSVKIWNNQSVVIKDVRTNCFRASLLHTQIHTPRHEWERPLSTKWTMIGQMATAIAFPGLYDLGRSVTPLFFSETDFIYNYLHIVQKWTKNQCGKLHPLSVLRA